MDPLSQDQTFFAARLAGYDYFADIAVLEQQRGVLEADIEQALSTLNQRQGRIGAVVIVLKPQLDTSNPDAAGPEYRVALTVQVITEPLFNDSPQGTGKGTAAIAAVVRQLGHRFATPGGIYSFTGMQSEEVAAGKDSYSVTFTRLARDNGTRTGLPLISPDEGASPQEVTLSCADAGATILYTLDGTYPSPLNRAALAYSEPFDVAQACTLLAVAYLPGQLPSGLAAATFT